MTEDGLGELSRAVECLLFASAETLTRDRLVDVLEAAPEQVGAALEQLKGSLAERGLQVVQLAGGYQLATRPEYAGFVHRLLQPAPARLSAQALETLAIVAYRQPITRPEIDAVRGVNSQHAVASLTEKGLVTTVGRKDAPGRPVLYATTPHFLSTFGLKDLQDLPSLEQLRESLAPMQPMVLQGVVTPTGKEVPDLPPEEEDEGHGSEAEPEFVEAQEPSASPEG
jgi:segregation and condensation protein B